MAGIAATSDRTFEAEWVYAPDSKISSGVALSYWKERQVVSAAYTTDDDRHESITGTRARTVASMQGACLGFLTNPVRIGH